MLLSVKGLTVRLTTSAYAFNAVSDVSFDLASGETLCLVGESGCGKSMTALAVMRLTPDTAKATAGSILFEGGELSTLSASAMADIRGRRIGMVFQEPMTSLNPVLPVGEQVAEVLIRHRRLSRREAETQGIEMLGRVGVPDPAARFRDYPHQLSGGLRQRVMIAAALVCGPALLIADEPTTALDVTVQRQILDLLRTLQSECGMGLLLITHDLGIVAGMADNVGVMYAGHMVEYGPTVEVLGDPRHPYTKGLIDAVPQFGPGRPGRLHTIGGSVPSSAELAVMTGCPFRPRCPAATWQCFSMPSDRVSGRRRVACFHPSSGVLI